MHATKKKIDGLALVGHIIGSDNFVPIYIFTVILLACLLPPFQMLSCLVLWNLSYDLIKLTQKIHLYVQCLMLYLVNLELFDICCKF